MERCTCGEPGEYYDGEDNRYICEACDSAKAATRLLALHRSGRTERFLEELTEEGRRHIGGGNEVEVLIREAWEYAARGDLDEAAHRLRLAAEPKFNSTADCQMTLVYDDAVKENIAREATA